MTPVAGLPRVRRLGQVAACLLLGSLSATPASSEEPVEHVILVSVDGLMPTYYLEPDRHGLRIPILREMVAAGFTFRGAEGVFPTVTYPSHASIVTGVDPIDHGVDANGPLDPFDLTRGGWYWYSEDLRSPAIWDVAKKAGKTTASVFWPVTVGAAVDVNYPEYRTLASDDDVKLLRALATPGLIRGIEAQYGQIPGRRPDDRVRAQAASYIIERHRPNLLLLHLTDLDGAQHRSGPGSEEALSTLEQIDGHLGKVRDAVRRAGIAERTAWVVVSDHGFRAVSRQFHPRAVLRSLGYLTYDVTGALTDWRAYARTAGGTFALVAKDPADTAVIEHVTRHFRTLADDPHFGIARLYSPEEARKSGGFPGAFLVGELTDGFMVGGGVSGAFVTDSTSKGMHGYHPSRADQVSALLLSGAGIATGRTDRAGKLIDVAPTVARLLGFSMESAKGRPLSEALQP